MQCSITLQRGASGNKMKTNSYKNPYKKESNLDTIVDQLCTKLQDIKDQEENASRAGMPTCTLEHSEAVRRYYAAFPALKKGQESPLQYYLPPPAWCRKPADGAGKMQSELPAQDWNTRNRKYSGGKERRNSYHGQKRNRKRCNNYSRSCDGKERLPEWVTHEGEWDMEAQDPVKEFIRALALDEGYGTCENTVTDEPRGPDPVPDPDSLDLDSVWVIDDDLAPRVLTPMEEELYAKFEAKFDRSIEALWSKEQGTPDDEYQELPIDFQDLLSSPSDGPLLPGGGRAGPAGGGGRAGPAGGARSPALHDRFRPLNLADAPEIESFVLYEGAELEALPAVASSLRSYAAINHCKERSGFAEVPPRRGAAAPPPAPPAPAPAAPPDAPAEDLLTSARTHFRPIRREDPPRYADGDTFDIRGDLDSVDFQRSDSGGAYYESALYLEYRTRSIDYGRLNLTESQRTALDEGPRFRLRFPVRQRDAGVQTERAWGECDECGGTAKKMRPAMQSIWSSGGCAACGDPAPPPAAAPPPAPAPPPDELSREWEELLSDISAAHAEYSRDAALVSAERKRRHSAALRPPRAPPSPPARRAPHCSHPHARFLHCSAALDRPLTR